MKRKMSALNENESEDLTPDKKCTQGAARELTDCKKSCNDTENATSLSKVINLGMPHIGEQTFKYINTSQLVNFLEV